MWNRKKKDALLKRDINSSIKSCEIPDESGIQWFNEYFDTT